MGLLDSLSHFVFNNNQNAVNGIAPIQDLSPLGRFGLYSQGQGAVSNYQKSFADAQQQSNLSRLGSDLAAGKIDQTQYLKQMAQYDPQLYGKLALSQMGVDLPSAAQNWLFKEKLPKDQQSQFEDKYVRPPQWLNAGGSFINPATNSAIPVTPKPEEMPNFKGAQAEATAAGQVKGQNLANAQLNYPDFAAGVNNQLSVIDQMIGNKQTGVPEHPGLKQAVGGVISKLPSARDDTLDFENLLEQAKSEAFLSSIKQMQGFGALSNEEGAKATTAATRMKTASSEKGFRDAAQEYRNIIESGLQRMQKKVGAAPNNTPQDTSRNEEYVPTGQNLSLPQGWTIKERK